MMQAFGGSVVVISRQEKVLVIDLKYQLEFEPIFARFSNVFLIEYLAERMVLILGGADDELQFFVGKYLYQGGKQVRFEEFTQAGTGSDFIITMVLRNCF